MHLSESPADAAFRAEVRTFLRENIPADLHARAKQGLHPELEDYTRWMKILAAKGWLAASWPKEAGGPGWNAAQRAIFEEECILNDAPPVLPIGLTMVGPVLLAFGTAAQKEKYLPPILSADEIWGQGYSEPGAGSDLASLKCAAVRDGDDYIVNGTKIWSGRAQWCHRIFTLVRTDNSRRKQEGISILLIDRNMPGITIRPLYLLDGTHYFNQIFFDDVRVPASDRVGAENEGWTIAKYLLEHERSGASAELPHTALRIARARAMAAAEEADDPALARRYCDHEIASLSATLTQNRLLGGSDAAHRVGPEASLVKIRGTELNQAIADDWLAAVGPYAAPFSVEALHHGWNEPPVGPADANAVVGHYWKARKYSIWGGSNEIQRNVIAKQVLRLP